MSDQIILGSPTDRTFIGPVERYTMGHDWSDKNKYPKCPVCDGGYGEHSDKDCPHKELEKNAKIQFDLVIRAAVDNRQWLLVDEHDAKFTGG